MWSHKLGDKTGIESLLKVSFNNLVHFDYLVGAFRHTFHFVGGQIDFAPFVIVHFLLVRQELPLIIFLFLGVSCARINANLTQISHGFLLERGAFVDEIAQLQILGLILSHVHNFLNFIHFCIYRLS